MQSKVSQKEKERYPLLTHTHTHIFYIYIYIYIYIYSRKMILKNLFARQEYRHRHREQTCGHSEGRRGRDKLKG